MRVIWFYVFALRTKGLWWIILTNQDTISPTEILRNTPNMWRHPSTLLTMTTRSGTHRQEGAWAGLPTDGLQTETILILAIHPTTGGGTIPTREDLVILHPTVGMVLQGHLGEDIPRTIEAWKGSPMNGPTMISPKSLKMLVGHRNFGLNAKKRDVIKLLMHPESWQYTWGATQNHTNATNVTLALHP